MYVCSHLAKPKYILQHQQTTANNTGPFSIMQSTICSPIGLAWEKVQCDSVKSEVICMHATNRDQD